MQPLRLSPGLDLRRELERLVRSGELPAGFVACGVGSLHDAKLRYAAQSEATISPGPHEVLTLSGSLTVDGAHLHLTVADAAGRVTGGHLAYGNTVRTTMELLVQPTPGWRLSRERDAATGDKELVVRPEPGAPPQP